MFLKINSGIAMLLILLSSAAVANPQNNNVLKGTIKDKNGSPLPGTLIVIPDLKTGTTADSLGFYELDELPKGKFLVEVKLLTYATKTENISIDSVTTHNFVLNETIIERNEVVITGTSLATEERKSVAPIQSVSMKQLQENPSTNVIDAISKLPGISQLKTGPAISKPVIRGLGYNRIITLNDGVRQEGQQWGDEHGIEIDDYNVTRVEVLKGPASLAYGSDALAGVINIISDEQIPANTVLGNVTANYQTNNGLGAVHAHVKGNENGINWDIYYTGKRAHDYQNKYDGYVFDSRFNNDNYGASIGINKRWGNSRLSFTSFNQNLGISEGERDSASGAFIMPINNQGMADEQIVPASEHHSYSMVLPRQHIAHQKLVWDNNLHFSNGGRLGLILGYQRNTREEFEDVLDPNEPGLHFLLQTYNYDLKYFFPSVKGWQITTGVNGMKQDNQNKGVEFLIPDYHLFDAGVYAIAKKEWNKWTVSGGVRFDHRSISGDNLFLDSNGVRIYAPETGNSIRFNSFNKNFSNFSGSIGTAYNMNEHTTFKFNVASGFRAPNIAELAANGVHEGTVRYEYGNKNLQSENSIQADLGASWSSDHVLINASLFYNYIRNFIYVSKLATASGLDSIPTENNDEGYPAYEYNQRNAALFGGEIYIDIHPHPFDWLHFENTFSYVRGVFINGKDSTKNIPSIPAARWLPELRAQKRRINNLVGNGFIKTGLDINFPQNNVFSAYGTETATSGYTLWNASLGFDLLNKKQHTVCSITIAGDNLTDVAYQNHLSRLKYTDVNNATGRQGIFGMGRNFSVTVSVPIGLQ